MTTIAPLPSVALVGDALADLGLAAHEPTLRRVATAMRETGSR